MLRVGPEATSEVHIWVQCRCYFCAGGGLEDSGTVKATVPCLSFLTGASQAFVCVLLRLKLNTATRTTVGRPKLALAVAGWWLAGSGQRDEQDLHVLQLYS